MTVLKVKFSSNTRKARSENLVCLTCSSEQRTFTFTDVAHCNFWIANFSLTLYCSLDIFLLSDNGQIISERPIHVRRTSQILKFLMIIFFLSIARAFCLLSARRPSSRSNALKNSLFCTNTRNVKMSDVYKYSDKPSCLLGQ